MNHIPFEALWILCGEGLAWLLVFFCIAMLIWRRKADPPRFESHWGGLGRGLGGWSISWTLVLSLIALVLTFGVVITAVEVVSPSQSDTDTKQGSKETQKSAPANNPQRRATATDTAKTAEKQ